MAWSGGLVAPCAVPQGVASPWVRTQPFTTRFKRRPGT